VAELWKRLVRDDKYGPLPGLLVLLTFVTGIVDAVAILRLDRVFVANMTGNVVFVGFALAGARGFSLGASLGAIGSFLVGASLGGRLVSRPFNRGRVLGVAALVQLVGVLVSLSIAAAVHGHPGSGTRLLLVLLLSVGSGMQNAVVRHLAVPDLTTSVLTMALTGLAAEAHGGGWRKLAFRMRILAVLVMSSGALAGALLVLHAQLWSPLLLAAVVLGITGALATVLSSGRPSWTASG